MRIKRQSVVHGFAIVAFCVVPLWCAQAATQTWVQHFRAPGKTNNVAVAIATDRSGNAFVTGYSYNGVRTSDQWTTIAYAGSGVPLWTNFYIGPAGINDYATALAIDDAGCVFVTGYSASTSMAPYNYDIVTIKYSDAGKPLWTNRYNGPADAIDQPSAIAVNGSGDVLVTGYSANLNSHPFDYDYVTIKYASTGDSLWINRYSGPSNGDDVAVALALNDQGNVFVTGSSAASGSSTDYLTIAYSNSGLALWTNRYNGSGNWADFPTAIAADAAGDVFVTGYSASANVFPHNYDCITIKYSSAGVPLWTNRYDGLGNSDYAEALAMDGEGDVFVTGRSVGNHYDFVTLKYSGTGMPQWTNRWNGPGNSDDSPVAIALDGAGNVFVAGRSFLEGTSYNHAVIAYSNGGVPLWTSLYNAPGNFSDAASAIAVDGSGNVFVTGTSSGSDRSSDYTTIKYAPSVRLNIEKTDAHIVLTWNNAAFGLQSAPAVTGTFTNIPGATSPYTNPISGTQQFFRLISN